MPRSRENKVNLRQLMISDHLIILGAGSLELEEHLSLCFNGCRWTPFVHTKIPPWWNETAHDYTTLAEPSISLLFYA